MRIAAVQVRVEFDEDDALPIEVMNLVDQISSGRSDHEEQIRLKLSALGYDVDTVYGDPIGLSKTINVEIPLEE